MKTNRRGFLHGLAAGGCSYLFAMPKIADAAAEEFAGWPDRFGMLTDLSLCIGCRKCEEACKTANNLPPIDVPLEDQAIFKTERRTDAENHTVVNRYATGNAAKPFTFVKKQCMHCDEPACAAACLVGAFTKSPEGAVLYNKDVCLGCRYCMIACPFSIPAYEYFDAASPEVKKCTLCFERTENGDIPACAEICPTEAITFGRRSELIEMAREKIRNTPGKYQDHIYGLAEAGGTSWLYISEQPFEELGFPAGIGSKPYAEYTRSFLSMVPVVFVVWPALLAGTYAFSRNRVDDHEKAEPPGEVAS